MLSLDDMAGEGQLWRLYSRYSALVGPVLELNILDGQSVVVGLDIAGENFAIRHGFGVSRARSGGARSRLRAV